MDRQTILWVVMANLLAGGMMYQRLDKLGYLAPVKEQVSAVVEPVLEALGLFHASYQQCGLQDSTMFVLTSSRVVHPDGVRPGASELSNGVTGWHSKLAASTTRACSARIVQVSVRQWSAVVVSTHNTPGAQGHAAAATDALSHCLPPTSFSCSSCRIAPCTCCTCCLPDRLPDLLPAVTVRGGQIVSVTDRLPARSRYPVIDYGSAVISPGVIDVHVHMNEPGREDWEGVQGSTSNCLAFEGRGGWRVRAGCCHR